MTVLLVDVSSGMDALLPALKRSLFIFVHSQLVFKPDNEVALLLFGTEGTDNDLHEEMKNRKKRGQYLHVKEIKLLRPPDLKYLEAVEGITAEKGTTNYADALTVAIDCLKRRLAVMTDPTKYPRRILIFSNFNAEVTDTVL